MLEELGIHGGTAIVILVVLYFIVKWAVKNGIEEAYEDIANRRASEGDKEAGASEED